MEEKNELNDILLGETQNSQSGGKKMIIIGSAILLLFFAIIAVMKMVNSSDSKPSQLPIDSAQMKAKAPELPAAAIQGQDANAASSATAPADEKLNEIVKKLQQDAQNAQTKPADSQAAQPAAVVKNEAVEVPIKAATPAATAAATAPNVVIKEHPTMEPPKQKHQAPVAAQTQQPAKKPKEQPQHDVKKSYKEATKKTVPAKPKAAAPSKQHEANGAQLYMQIGRFSSEKNFEVLLPKIKAAGLNYVIKKDDQNRSRVLIGPYKSVEERAKDAAKIKGQIEPKAFPVKG